MSHLIIENEIGSSMSSYITDNEEASRIENVLKEANSTSDRFQIRVLLIVSLSFFAQGFLCYTFIFMFLSPDFYVKDNKTNRIITLFY